MSDNRAGGASGSGAQDRVSFGSSSGKVMGVLTVGTALLVAALALLDRHGRPAYELVALAVFVGALGWAAMLRPALSIVRGRLVLRNMLQTVTVPLEAIQSVDVRQVLVVRAGDRKITSSAISRSRRQLSRDTRPAGMGGSMLGSMLPTFGSEPDVPVYSYGLLVEEQLRARVTSARDVAGIANRSKEQEALAEQIESRPAVVEIAVLLVSLVAFVVLVLT